VPRFARAASAVDVPSVRFNFDHAMNDVSQLLDIHDAKTAAKRGRLIANLRF
jgi:hypothetical protein